MREITEQERAESHRRQLAGEDWYAVAVEMDLFDDGGDFYEGAMSAPSDACECDACMNAEWWD